MVSGSRIWLLSFIWGFRVRGGIIEGSGFRVRRRGLSKPRLRVKV